MNIFVLDKNLKQSVIYHPNKHIVKMPIEGTQMLCSVLYLSGNWEDWMYKPTHLSHPCTQWVYTSLDNWVWLREYVVELGREYTYRYGKIHKSVELAKRLPMPNIELKGLLEFVKCMPSEYIVDSVVESYRNYFKGEKESLKEYKNREVPNWWL